MKPLVDMLNMKDRKVPSLLIMLPASPYYKADVSDVKNSLSRHGARRHLTHLVMLNDKEKSKLSRVDEESRA